jgi:3-oxoacyl-[acyl-carrier-protein] synthase II
VPVCWWNMAKLDSLGILSTRNELHAGACAPFDRDRDGTVFGEGSAYLVLEDKAAAVARGARVYAEVVGFGGASDTEHLGRPDPEGRALAKAIESALGEADSAPADVGYVAAHGSGSKHGDASETNALRSVLGSTVASSVKPATGHLVAAAGALNAAVAALTLSNGVLPPTLNLNHLDPGCEGIDWNPGIARETSASSALALARGFEGQNVALALRAV